jgi:orotate phosphoribosyltransferase
MATEVTPDGDLLAYLGTQSDNAMAQHLPAVQAYRDRYGVT